MIPGRLEELSVLLFHAYLDGELDPTNALGIAEKIESEPALAAERDCIVALQKLLRIQGAPELPPPGLRARIETAVSAEFAPG